MTRGFYVETPPAQPPRPLACLAYLLLPPRELTELMRAQSTAALDLARRSLLEVPRANH